MRKRIEPSYFLIVWLGVLVIVAACGGEETTSPASVADNQTNATGPTDTGLPDTSPSLTTTVVTNPEDSQNTTAQLPTPADSTSEDRETESATADGVQAETAPAKYLDPSLEPADPEDPEPDTPDPTTETTTTTTTTTINDAPTTIEEPAISTTSTVSVVTTSSTTTEPTTTETTEPPTTTTSTTPDTRPPAPEFQLSLFGGDEFNLHSTDLPIVMMFWAEW